MCTHRLTVSLVFVVPQIPLILWMGSGVLSGTQEYCTSDFREDSGSTSVGEVGTEEGGGGASPVVLFGGFHELKVLFLFFLLEALCVNF